MASLPTPSVSSFKLLNTRSRQNLSFDQSQQIPLTFNNRLPIFIPGVAEIRSLLPSLFCYPFKFGVTVPEPIIAPKKPVPVPSSEKEVWQQDVTPEVLVHAERVLRDRERLRPRPLVMSNFPPPPGLRYEVNNGNGERRKAIPKERIFYQQSSASISDSGSTVLTLKPVHHCNCVKCSMKKVKYYPHQGGSEAPSKTLSVREKQGKFPCPKCGKEFASARSLKHHLTFYTVNKSQSSCFFCKRVFDSSYNLNKHLFRKHMSTLSQMFRCYYCNQTFLSQTLLDNHVVRHLSA